MYTKDRKVSYYASKISDNISETPEGYLICHNVPIARTGVQEYLGQELGIADKYDQYVKVYRLPEDVFAAEAMASFEGKPFTNNHPDPKVDINNVSIYGKGHAQNIRQSTSEGDLLLADIVVQDPMVISEIKNGIKREISSGYDCYYVPYKDGYRQIEIRGNHIALVSKGRAGDRVSIKDNKTERKEKMAKKSNILAAMLKAFARDAEPDEVADAMEALQAHKDEEAIVEEKEVTKVEEKDDDPLAGLVSRLDAMEAKLDKLFSAEKEEGHSELEDEDPEVEEEKEEIDVEDADPEEKESEEEEKEEEVVTSKDSLDALKVAVARIRNPQDKKRVSDALQKVYGKATDSKNVYDSVAKISAKASAKLAAQDSAPEDLADLGKKIAAKFNPHYKETK